MILHAFAFRWTPAVTEDQKTKAHAAILALQGQIPGLLETHAGINFSPRAQGYQFAGVMKFTDKAAFDAYAGHPVHQALLAWLMPLVEPIEIDFESSVTG